MQYGPRTMNFYCVCLICLCCAQLWFCGPEEKAKRFLSRTPNAAGKKPNPGKPTRKQPGLGFSCKHGNGSGVLSDRPDRKNTERGNALFSERTLSLQPTQPHNHRNVRWMHLGLPDLNRDLPCGFSS